VIRHGNVIAFSGVVDVPSFDGTFLPGDAFEVLVTIQPPFPPPKGNWYDYRAGVIKNFYAPGGGKLVDRLAFYNGSEPWEAFSGIEYFPIVPGYPIPVDVSFGGLTEFDGRNATPEPATWATILIGVGMLGAVLRRRRECGSPLPSFL
jgi:hypothetical protein